MSSPKLASPISWGSLYPEPRVRTRRLRVRGLRRAVCLRAGCRDVGGGAVQRGFDDVQRAAPWVLPVLRLAPRSRQSRRRRGRDHALLEEAIRAQARRVRT